MTQENEIPRCDVPGCTRKAQGVARLKDGSIRYRKSRWVKKKYGKHLKGWVCAFHHTGHYNMGKMAYRKYVEGHTQCSNRDGRLGFPCVLSEDWYKTMLDTGLLEPHQLQALLDCDHIDGDPNNHAYDNIQIICKPCHGWKTLLNKDWLPSDHPLRQAHQKSKDLNSLFVQLTD